MSTAADNKKFFTDFDGRFIARLSSVIPVRRSEIPSETTGISAKYDCKIKTEYQKDLMGLLEEGMLLFNVTRKHHLEEKVEKRIKKWKEDINSPNFKWTSEFPM